MWYLSDGNSFRKKFKTFEKVVDIFFQVEYNKYCQEEMTMFKKIKKWWSDQPKHETVNYARPKLEIHFNDGEIRQCNPVTYCMRSTTWRDWVKDGILLERFPLASIKEIIVLGWDELDLEYLGGSTLYNPNTYIYMTHERLEKLTDGFTKPITDQLVD